MDYKTEKIAEQIKKMPEKQQKELIEQLQKLSNQLFDEEKIQTAKLMTLQEILLYGVNDLVNTKPIKLYINGIEQNFGTTWTDFSVHCVKQFVKNEDIPKNFQSVVSKNGKPFLIPRLSFAEQFQFDHKFDMVTPFCYIDTKYNVRGHIQNIVQIMTEFGILGKYRIEVAFSKKQNRSKVF